MRLAAVEGPPHLENSGAASPWTRMNENSSSRAASWDVPLVSKFAFASFPDGSCLGEVGVLAAPFLWVWFAALGPGKPCSPGAVILVASQTRSVSSVLHLKARVRSREPLTPPLAQYCLVG